MTAQCEYPGGTFCATPEVVENGIPGSHVAVQPKGPTSTLPFTGGDVGGIAAIGLILAVGGALIVRKTKLREAANR